jgi:hypothetical protein
MKKKEEGEEEDEEDEEDEEEEEEEKEEKEEKKKVKTIPKSVYSKLENCRCCWLIISNTGFTECGAESK